MRASVPIIVSWDLGETCGYAAIKALDPPVIFEAGQIKRADLGDFLDRKFPEWLEIAGNNMNLYVGFEQPPRGVRVSKAGKAERAVIANWQRTAEQCVAILLDRSRKFEVQVPYPRGFMPNTVKKAVTGNGKADKVQVREMAEFLFEGAEFPSDKGDHIHDAAAVGYTLLNRLETIGG